MNQFQLRRAQFMSKMQNNSLAIFPAAQEVIRNNDCEYPFRQNSDFYYLTGFDEPDALLVLINMIHLSYLYYLILRKIELLRFGMVIASVRVVRLLNY